MDEVLIRITAIRGTGKHRGREGRASEGDVVQVRRKSRLGKN